MQERATAILLGALSFLQPILTVRRFLFRRVWLDRGHCCLRETQVLHMILALNVRQEEAHEVLQTSV